MHLGVTSKTRENSFFPVWVRQRELRHRFPVGHSNVFYKSLYSSISLCHFWSEGEDCGSEHGGLFSLGFSPDGTLLVAGCERNCLLMFDPLTRRLIRTVHNAHENVVTNVKFLDSHNFATGSVDRTVSVWDTRNLKSKIRTLRGHSSPIGNIEFSPKNDLLITAEFDGFVSTWDINNSDQTENFCRKICLPYVHPRLRLNPDESKMIISTAMGYLMVVHELDLNTLAEDLDEFEFKMFGFAHLHQRTPAPNRDWSRFLSSNRRRNRVEIVADFPNAGASNDICALEMHPQGWSVISRSKSEISGKEWTCVHDIQEKKPFEGETAPRWGSGDKGPPCPQQDIVGAERRRLERINEERISSRGDVRGTGSLENERFFRASNNSSSEPLERTSGESSCVRNVWENRSVPEIALSVKRGSRKRRNSSPADSARVRNSSQGPCSVSPGPVELASRGTNSATDQPTLMTSDSSDPQLDHNVHESFPRLTHYCEEPDATVWYGESISVSADGRLICSPCDLGVRLLTFSPECSEQSLSWCGTKPRLLHALSTHVEHSDSVICTKFSPRHCLFVSGCYAGELAWYQPVV